MQIAPDPKAKTVRVAAEIVAGGRPAQFRLRTDIVTAKHRKPSGRAVSHRIAMAAHEQRTVDFVLSLNNAHPWSPEDPFLHELKIDTGADAISVRFGLRSFSFDPAHQRAILNDQLYYLRGSNITIDRFFEDSGRTALPWTGTGCGNSTARSSG